MVKMMGMSNDFENELIQDELEVLAYNIKQVHKLPVTDKSILLLDVMRKVKLRIEDMASSNTAKCGLIQQLPLLYLQSYRLRKEIV